MNNLKEYNYITENQNELNSVSHLEKSDLEYVVSESVFNYPFGKTPKDSIEIGAYDISSGELVSWNYLTASIKETTKESVYTDLTGNVIRTEYVLRTSDYVVLNGVTQSMNNPRELVIDPYQDLQLLDIPQSPYNFVYSLVTNEVGDYDNRLRVLQSSPSRKELKVSTFLNSSDQTILEFNKFKNDSIFGSDVFTSILDEIRKGFIQNEYFRAIEGNDFIVDTLKYHYSMPRDIDVINFCNDLYFKYASSDSRFTILYQFQNWLIENSDKEISFNGIRNRYRDIADYLIRFKLNSIISLKAKNFEDIVSLLKNIFDGIFLNSINSVEKYYYKYRGRHLKVFMNFGGEMLPILNWKRTADGFLALKLKDPFPERLSGKNFYLSRLIIDPVLVKPSFYRVQGINLNQLAPPNFSISEKSISTKEFSQENLSGENFERIKISLNSYENKDLNIDFTEFKNFVKFSSAQRRLDNFISKYDRIAELLDRNTQLSVIGDVYSLSEIENNNIEIDSIKRNFDGYENFLYLNPEYITLHNESTAGGLTKASEYDETNEYSLRNNTADYILEDSLNSEYVKFIDMIGHHFDNIFTYVDGFNRNKKLENSPQRGMLDAIIKNMLSDLGWDISGDDSSSLLFNLFGESDDAQIIETSGEDRDRIVWRRLLVNLPYLLKTKGTEECIRALFNVYGIPRSLYTIKEFGSFPTNSSQKNKYIFDNEYYALHFTGSNEYIQIPWNPDIKSVEFKVSFDSDKLHEEGSIFRLVSLENNWTIGSIRDKGEATGKVFFTLAESPGDLNNIVTCITDTISLFDGSTYSVLLRKNNVSGLANDIVTVCSSQQRVIDEETKNLIPTQYDLIVKRATDGEISAQTSASFIVSNGYNETFSGHGGEIVYVGNYNQISDPITPDPDAFFGTIDQVKFYKNVLSEKRFDSHIQYVDAYDIDEYENLKENLVAHLKFNYPQDLFSGSASQSLSDGFVSISNNAITSPISDIRAYNFPNLSEQVEYGDCSDCCLQFPQIISYVSSSFPWHFKKFETIEIVNVPNFGGSSFKNNKIFYDINSYSGSLYVDSKATPAKDFNSNFGSPTIGIFFSPKESENLEILKFFGDVSIGDFIGDPGLLYEKTYKEFNKFKRIFYDDFKGVNYHDYINMIKHYVDKGIFDKIEKTIPARSDLKTGILIEPSLLERNKYQYKTIDVENKQFLAAVDTTPEEVGSAVYGICNDASVNLSDSVDSTIDSSRSAYSNINNNYFPDLLSPAEFGIFSRRGVVRKDGRKYFAEKYDQEYTYEVVNKDRSKKSTTDIPTDTDTATITRQRINLIQLSDTVIRDTSFYYDDYDSMIISGSNFTGSISRLKPSDSPPPILYRVSGTFYSGNNTIYLDGTSSQHNTSKINVYGIMGADGSFTSAGKQIVSSSNISFVISSSLYDEKFSVGGTFTVLDELNSLGAIRDFWSDPDRIPHGELGSVFVGYSRQHRRNQRQILNKMSVQNTNTTVTLDGLLDGSPPVEGDLVDRGTINVETEGEGIVLSGRD